MPRYPQSALGALIESFTIRTMRSLLKVAANAVLVVGGFVAVFFAATKLMGDKNMSTTIANGSPDVDFDDIDIGVVHADVPTG